MNKKFKRYIGNPIIPRINGTFHSIHAANPDLLFFKGKYHLYFRGQAEEGYDQIGVAYATPNSFDGIRWDYYESNPIIRCNNGYTDFDSQYILDPASIELNGQVYLFYSAHPKDRSLKYNICLAISDDGTHFRKVPGNTIIKNAICPEVVFWNNKVFLFYQRLHKEGYFEIYRTESIDGLHFDIDAEKVIFLPSQSEGSFDKFSISTVRIFKEDEWFYMTYGGCEKYFDYPVAIGLARSKDLLNWERYPNNPIFERGREGTWDEAAIWFATIEKKGLTYYMWYEGAGTGGGIDSPKAKELSKKCREEDYGGYREFSFSQIGLATFEGKLSW